MLLGKVRKLGFTMIELLVVIAVIGILAVALLATLNPLEQIRKGRDTRTRSDAAQLASALERYNASLGRFPWQATEGAVVGINFLNVKTGVISGADGCSASLPSCNMHTTTGTGVLDQLTGTNEVKSSFIDRITTTAARTLYVFYNPINTGASVTVCFMPESNTFAREAFDRCKLGDTGFGPDIVATGMTPATRTFGTATQTNATASLICPDGAAASNYTAATAFNASDVDELICLP